MNEKTYPVVELEAKDLPAYCPNPAMPLWSSHPRVFLDFDHHGHAKCPLLRHPVSGGAGPPEAPLIFTTGPGMRRYCTDCSALFEGMPGYRAPLWLPGGNLQTIYPAVCISKPEVAFRRER